MSSPADRKRKHRETHAFVVVDDITQSEPPTEQQRRALLKWMTDTSIMRACRVDRPMHTVPGDILTASDRGRIQ